MTGILTAQHAANGRVTIYWQDGTSTSTDGRKYDKYNYDIAFIPTENKSIKPLKIAERPPSIGERVKLYGYGCVNGRTPRRWYATYQGYSFYGTDSYDAPGIQGDSGGAVLNACQEIVGIISAGSGDVITIIDTAKMFPKTCGPPLAPIRAFLTRVWNSRHPQQQISRASSSNKWRH